MAPRVAVVAGVWLVVFVAVSAVVFVVLVAVDLHRR